MRLAGVFDHVRCSRPVVVVEREQKSVLVARAPKLDDCASR